jgi:L-fuconolactonase
LRKFNLTYDILIFPNQLESAIQLVKKFPNQKFILDHSAKPDIKNQRINFWKRQIEILAESPNVFCKISGIVTEANLSHWEYEDFTPYLNVVFNAFGEDRIMFGSDWPVCLLAASYKEVYDLILNYINDFSEHQKAKLLGLNALRIYNITD